MELLQKELLFLLIAFPKSLGIYASTVLWPKMKELTKALRLLAVKGNSSKVSTKNYPKPGTHSYLSVPGSEPLLDLTVGTLFDQTVRQFPDCPAILASTPLEIRKNYKELKTEVDKLAAGLLNIGLVAGDRVGIWGPNSYEWYLTFLAVTKCGLVAVHINPAYQTRELEYCINKVGIKCMMIADQFKSSNYYAMMAEICPEVESCTTPGKIQGKVVPTFTTLITFSSSISTTNCAYYTLEQVIQNGSSSDALCYLEKAADLVQSDDLVNIQFTSGTTGNPKGIMLSHHTILNDSYLLGKRIGYTQHDKLCIPCPLFHGIGCIMGALPAIHSGAAVVLPSPGFCPASALKAISEERCTAVYGTPTMHIDLINAPNFDQYYDLSSLKVAVTAGAICPEAVARGMKEKYFIENVTMAYGLIETSTIVLMSVDGDTEEERAETVGYPMEHVEVKIVSQEGRTVELGQQGELCIRGFSVMMGYWEDPVKTNEAIDPSRWFHTGDLAVMLESGHVRIVGRLKDVIIRGGENIYPRDIEDFLQTHHPAIQEVQVFSVPDFRMGEEVCAWVKLIEGAELNHVELRAFCKGKIAHYKVPKHIKFVEKFPTTTSGKVQKFVMSELMSKELGITSQSG